MELRSLVSAAVIAAALAASISVSHRPSLDSKHWPTDIVLGCLSGSVSPDPAQEFPSSREADAALARDGAANVAGVAPDLTLSASALGPPSRAAGGDVRSPAASDSSQPPSRPL